ncbi:MFS transporter [Kitasatospora xanthocidica]|uniref:MFS transporter n=1 Tax=Kitasatospora xanthocidica TaxID=83382 RepID=A0A372ZRA0_9ACTN|nr:MFS transporter [Kitasatospora xanthocidica]RGD57715.1 MFS transporter [Kitasatospora xanthocidica]
MNPPRHHRGLVLAASITGAVLVAVDGTALTVARPALQHDLHASVAAVQWASTGYLVTVAALLVFAGRLGDRYGHRRVFALGVTGFAAASLGIAVAPGIGWVVALRVLQGAAGALLQPATLGMLRAAWPADRLAGPIAIRTAAIGLAAAAGPLVGGALTAHLGWRSVFLLGLLPAAAALLAALAVPAGAGSPGTRSPAAGRGNRHGSGLDLSGAALLALALALLVQSLVTLPDTGRPLVPLLGLTVAGVLALVLVRHERRTTNPLLPPALLRSTAVAPPLVVLLAASAALQGTLFPATYYLQDVLGLDPLRSALRAVPLAVTMILAAPGSAWLAKRHGERAVVLPGMALITTGALLTALLGTGSGTLAIAGCFALLGTGFGAVMATATTMVVRGASAARAGVAGGLQQTVLNIGPALGIALATAAAGRTDPGAALAPSALTMAAVAGAGTLVAARQTGRAAGPTAGGAADRAAGPASGARPEAAGRR